MAENISLWAEDADPNGQAVITSLCSLFSICASCVPVIFYQLGASPSEASPYGYKHCQPTVPKAEYPSWKNYPVLVPKQQIQTYKIE